MLIEVFRKLWTGPIVQLIMNSLQKHSILSRNQHGSFPKHGIDTANLQLFNTLESAWDERRPLSGCSWDMKKLLNRFLNHSLSSVGNDSEYSCTWRKG